MAPLMGLGLILLFNVPGSLGGGAKVAYGLRFCVLLDPVRHHHDLHGDPDARAETVGEL